MIVNKAVRRMAEIDWLPVPAVVRLLPLLLPRLDKPLPHDCRCSPLGSSLNYWVVEFPEKLVVVFLSDLDYHAFQVQILVH